MRIPPPLPVDPADEAVLRSWIEDDAEGTAAARRARMILLSATGAGPTAVAAALGCSKQTVITWRERYRRDGLAGLRDAPRSGRPATVDPLAVVARTLAPPPGGAARWSTRLLADELGISNVAVANVWRAWGVRPAAAGQVQLATEPVLDRPVAAVVGLHVDPSVRVLALLVGDVRCDVTAVPETSDLEAGEEDAALKSFLDRLDDVRGGRSLQVGLVVAEATTRLQRWVLERPDVTLHVVPAAVSWWRPVRVACLLAGESGVAGDVAVRQAVTTYAEGRVFSWWSPTATNGQ